MAPPSDGPPDDRKGPDPTTTVKELKIRLDFAYDEKSRTPDVQGTLLKIFQAWKQANTRLTIHNDEDQPVTLDEWPEEPFAFQNLLKPKAVEKRQRHIVIVMKVISDSTLSQLRTQSWPILTANKVHMFQHYHASSRYDVTAIGWFTKTKPTTQSTIQFKAEVKQFLRTNMAKPNFDAKHRIKELFPDETKEKKFFLPNFEVIPGNPAVISSKTQEKVQTKALVIEVESKHVRYAKAILEECCNMNHPPQSRFDHLFVPYSAKFELQEALYAQVLREQNKFLDSTRNIPLAGISQEQMKKSVVQVEGVDFTPELVILNQPEVIRLDSHGLTPVLGRWNITVTEKGYATMLAWIDDQVPFLFPDPSPRFSNTDFPSPARMNKKKGYPGKTKPRESEIQYLRTMLSEVSTDKSMDGTGNDQFNRPNAWNAYRRPPTYQKNDNPQGKDTTLQVINQAEFPSLTNQNNSQVVTPSNQMAPETQSKQTIEQMIQEAISKSNTEWETRFTSVTSDIQDLKTSVSSIHHDIKEVIQNTVTEVTSQLSSSHASLQHSQDFSTLKNDVTELKQMLGAFQTMLLEHYQPQQIQGHAPSENTMPSIGTQPPYDSPIKQRPKRVMKDNGSPATPRDPERQENDTTMLEPKKLFIEEDTNMETTPTDMEKEKETHDVQQDNEYESI